MGGTWPPPMIDFHYWPTPNGKKVAIMLAECDAEYDLVPVDIMSGEQFEPDFLAISPNNKIPAIVDRDTGGEPLALFESGAILIYLARKFGRFLPEAGREHYEVLQWLMFQMASVGPMFGQCGHFKGYAPEQIDYAIDRYFNETMRLYGVMDRRLADRDFIAGDYSIADMAIYPWVDVRWLHDIDIDRFPAVRDWFARVGERPAVAEAMKLLLDREVIGNPDAKTRENFFGQSQTRQSRA